MLAPSVEQVAKALARLGAEKAMVIHSAEGLDEISLKGVTHAAVVENGGVSFTEIDPAGLGLSATLRENLIAEDVADAARIIRDVFDNAPGPHREIVALNCAAALVVADAAGDMQEGLHLAMQAIESGQAKETLESLVRLSHESA